MSFSIISVVVGNHTQNVEPSPCLLLKPISPCLTSEIALQIESPKPVP